MYVHVFGTDTVYVHVFGTDTVYVHVFGTDTVYVHVFGTDTVYVHVFGTDTVYTVCTCIWFLVFNLNLWLYSVQKTLNVLKWIFIKWIKYVEIYTTSNINNLVKIYRY